MTLSTLKSTSNLPPIDSSKQFVKLFDSVFLKSFNTRLQGGALEPLYVPENKADRLPAIIYFRENYLSSALHEISHWVIAGESRRQLDDYGYWYESDDRDELTQKRFEQVEIKPQAIELLFHLAAGLPFRVSVDNLSLPDYDSSPFEEKVKSQAYQYCLGKAGSTLPSRAKTFISSLLDFRGRSNNETPIEQWLLNQMDKKQFS